MGKKRIPLDLIYRPKLGGPDQELDPIVTVTVSEPLYLFGSPSFESNNPELILAHKRSVKAAAQRRYRANLKAKK